MKLMLNCQDVARIISSGEIERIGPMKRLMVRRHFAMCKCCSRYVQVLKNTLSLFRQRFQRADPEKAKQVADRIVQKLLQRP